MQHVLPRRMPSHRIQNLLILFATLLLTSCAGSGPSAEIELGQRAPDFSLIDLDGTRRSLSSYRGQPLVLNFWATWCRPCHQEIPDLQQLHTGGRIRILSVSIDEEGEAIVQPFVEEREIAYPVLLDADKQVFADRYGGITIPYTLLLDPDHVIRKIYRAPVEHDEVLADLSTLSSGVGAIGAVGF